MMTKVMLRKGAHDRVASGHPWVFASEVAKIEGPYEAGDIVDVYQYPNRFIGRGYINPKSQIIVRILSRVQEEIDREFFSRRIAAAWEYRKRFIKEAEYCRLIYGEADFLPALIVDKFGDILVIQTLSMGMERFKDTIVSVLLEQFEPRGIYERNDVPVRKLEGLPMQKGYVHGDFLTRIQVRENGFPFWADVEKGQKTGFFYDQRENRAFLKDIVPGMDVLDCFCHTGSFAVHAAAYGAKSVLAVDISEEAISLAKENAALNGVEEVCSFETANAFDLLRQYSDAGRQFDVVILDPPAFTKSRSSLEGAVRGYKEINLRGIKMTKPGGFLITCSCSYHMDRELFKAVIVDAAMDARRQIRTVEYRTQAKDHPILPAAEETEYLKFLVLQVW